MSCGAATVEHGLEGLHHITAITGDAPRNVDFYARVLGLRLVKKTVNFDQPDVYHLYYGDEAATPGAILTFFEFPGAAPGRARRRDGPHASPGASPSAGALDVLVRAAGATRASRRRVEGDALRFADPEGLDARAASSRTSPTRRWPRTPRESPPSTRCWASPGVRAYASRPAAQRAAARRARVRGVGRRLGLPRRQRGARATATTRRRRTRGRAGRRARSTTSRGRPPTTTSSSATARSRPPRAPGRRRSSTASTSTPSTSASRAACCSSSRRATSASTSTSR